MGERIPKAQQQTVEAFKRLLERLASEGQRWSQQAIADDIEDRGWGEIDQTTVSNFLNGRPLSAGKLLLLEMWYEEKARELSLLDSARAGDDLSTRMLEDLYPCPSCGRHVVLSRYCSECGNTIIPPALEPYVRKIVREELALCGR